MAGKRAKKDKEKPQVERFKEMAEELGADISAKTFEREFDKLVKPKPKESVPRRGRQG